MSSREELYSSEDLAQYLRQVRFVGKGGGNLVFDSFLENIDEFVALRMRAEEYWEGSPKGSAFNYIDHKYLANNPREALPLELEDILDELFPSEERPPRRIVLQIAHLIEEITHISSGMRRILLRERLSTRVSNVQQLDTHCIIWLMRQPGRSIIEKAGTKQRILSVVRRENFNTLENRVFKDFLLRSANLAERYIKSLNANFKNSNCNEYTSVKRLKLACLSALNDPEMMSISDINRLPQPNYVLLQDSYYSKIWNMYRKIIMQSKLAEKLWKYRNLIDKDIKDIKQYVKARCQNNRKFKYKSIAWINPLETSNGSLLDHFVKNLDLADEQILVNREQDNVNHMIRENIGVIDLTGEDVFGDYLIEEGIHQNALPRIDCNSYPLWDDQKINNYCSKIREHKIKDVCSKVEIQKAGRDNCLFEKYGHCLIGEYKTACNDLKELVILVPDDWDIYTQESIIRTLSSNISRDSVHLLWRSIAAVLGYQRCHLDFASKNIKENEIVLVADVRNDHTVLLSSIKYLLNPKNGKLIPQRGAYINENSYRHHGPYSLEREFQKIIRDIEREKNLNFILITGSVSKDILEKFRAYLRKYFVNNRIAVEGAEDDWLLHGARLFCKHRIAETLYYDELEPMFTICQEKENIVCPVLIPRDDRCEGGKQKTYTLPEDKFFILAGNKGIKFLFHIGSLNHQTQLHSYSQDLLVEKLNHNIALSGEIKVSPGQGLAITKIYSDELGLDIELDYLRNMKMEGDTIDKLENEIKRSYPPICPFVESYEDRSSELKNKVMDYIYGRTDFDDSDNGLFFKPKNIQESEIGPNDSALRLLGRKNIFGNDPDHLRPIWLSKTDEDKLLDRLSSEILTGRNKLITLLAWTYRGNHLKVKRVVEKIVDKYISKGSITAGEVSLLSNTLYDKNLKSLEEEVFAKFFSRVKRDQANLNDYRMIYNIAQFDGDLFNKIVVTEEEMIEIYDHIRDYISKQDEYSQKYKCALKCLLYFLKFREFNPTFLRKLKEYKNDSKFRRTDNMIYKMGFLHDALCEMLDRNKSRYYSYNTRTIKEIFKSFLEGNGQLKDIITIIHEDNKENQ